MFETGWRSDSHLGHFTHSKETTASTKQEAEKSLGAGLDTAERKKSTWNRTTIPQPSNL
jgi:hypothetical protein